jgi:hypothetical protein
MYVCTVGQYRERKEIMQHLKYIMVVPECVHVCRYGWLGIPTNKYYMYVFGTKFFKIIADTETSRSLPPISDPTFC